MIKKNYLIIFTIIMGLVILFVFPSPQENFIYYILTMFFFILLIIFFCKYKPKTKN
jgi:hypothetical protein